LSVLQIIAVKGLKYMYWSEFWGSPSLLYNEHRGFFPRG